MQTILLHCNTCSISNTSNCDWIYMWLLRICWSVYILCFIVILSPPPLSQFSIAASACPIFYSVKDCGLDKPLHNETERLIKDKMYIVLNELSQPQNKKKMWLTVHYKSFIRRLINECKWFTFFFHSIKFSRSFLNSNLNERRNLMYIMHVSGFCFFWFFFLISSPKKGEFFFLNGLFCL